MEVFKKVGIFNYLILALLSLFVIFMMPIEVIDALLYYLFIALIIYIVLRHIKSDEMNIIREFIDGAIIIIIMIFIFIYCGVDLFFNDMFIIFIGFLIFPLLLWILLQVKSWKEYFIFGDIGIFAFIVAVFFGIILTVAIGMAFLYLFLGMFILALIGFSNGLLVGDK